MGKNDYSLTFAFPPSIIEIAFKSGIKKLCHKAKELRNRTFARKQIGSRKKDTHVFIPLFVSSSHFGNRARSNRIFAYQQFGSPHSPPVVFRLERNPGRYPNL